MLRLAAEIASFVYLNWSVSPAPDSPLSTARSSFCLDRDSVVMLRVVPFIIAPEGGLFRCPLAGERYWGAGLQ